MRHAVFSFAKSNNSVGEAEAERDRQRIQYYQEKQ